MSVGRPIVEEAIAFNGKGTVHYFAFGSNLLRSKFEGRSISGRIESLSTTVGVAYGYRIAFNMRMYVPVEPSMAGLEPEEGDLCYGVLYELTPENYERLWISEGGLRLKPTYQEVLIDVEVCDSKRIVRAISLRFSDHCRLRKDLNPSHRYMTIILRGAREARLPDTYISRLEQVPTAQCSTFLRLLSIYYLYGDNLFTRHNVTVFRVHIGAFLSEVAAGLFLLPLSVLGAGARVWFHVTGATLTQPSARLVEYYSNWTNP